MKKPIIVSVLLIIAIIVTGCANNTEDIKNKSRYIKHKEIIKDFETYKGELVKVNGIVWLTNDYKKGDDIQILNVIDGEYSITLVQNNIDYKPYNGEYIAVYGKIIAISKEPVFFEVKAVRIEPKLIEQIESPTEELKNDILIQEFINHE